MTQRLSPSPDDAERELNRLADRLRVAGPRLAARGTPAAEQTLEQVRLGLQSLADLAAAANDEPAREIPILGPHALADQALVLGHDLLSGPAGACDVRRAEAVAALASIRDLL
jgi:hypothetical protein